MHQVLFLLDMDKLPAYSRLFRVIKIEPTHNVHEGGACNYVVDEKKIKLESVHVGEDADADDHLLFEAAASYDKQYNITAERTLPETDGIWGNVGEEDADDQLLFKSLENYENMLTETDVIGEARCTDEASDMVKSLLRTTPEQSQRMEEILNIASTTYNWCLLLCQTKG